MKSIDFCIADLIKSQILNYDNDTFLINAVNELLSGAGFEGKISFVSERTSHEISSEKFQCTLGNINEKTYNRKKNGVYYTAGDVSKFIIANTVLHKYKETKYVYSYNNCMNILKKFNNEKKYDIIFNMKVIDPTCGTGEFLINTFFMKYELCEDVTDEKLLSLLETIYGNDIDNTSVLISKIRVFFIVIDLLKYKDSYMKLAKILNKQFYCVDFITKYYKIEKKFDVIVGNPPYIEYNKYPNELLDRKFGNVYADILLNSFSILKDDGFFGFIIPLSYSSTPRMKKIREYVNKHTERQVVLSFADRPDCLFDGVHQKLNILISKCGSACKEIYTSHYIYWYKQERTKLFDDIEIIKNSYVEDGFIPKLGNKMEEQIYRKIISFSEENKKRMNFFVCSGDSKIYLNMRACFWIKAFSYNPGSKEYKEFSFSEKHKFYVLCLLNSSLFWFFWITISDCWHITAKELNAFIFKNISDYKKFQKLSLSLEKKLEDTKKYIGSKQTAYEYKHKMCKDIIDIIDDEIAKIYNLSAKENDYIKKFALKYRKGEGADD